MLDYDDVGLSAGTQITGFRWVTVLEDVRGVDNPASGLTASMIQFSPSGTISAVPEPSTCGCVIFGIIAGVFVRRRN